MCTFGAVTCPKVKQSQDFAHIFCLKPIIQCLLQWTECKTAYMDVFLLTLNRSPLFFPLYRMCLPISVHSLLTPLCRIAWELLLIKRYGCIIQIYCMLVVCFWPFGIIRPVWKITALDSVTRVRYWEVPLSPYFKCVLNACLNVWVFKLCLPLTSHISVL